jgi:hypothetical protein
MVSYIWLDVKSPVDARRTLTLLLDAHGWTLDPELRQVIEQLDRSCSGSARSPSRNDQDPCEAC